MEEEELEEAAAEMLLEDEYGYLIGGAGAEEEAGGSGWGEGARAGLFSGPGGSPPMPWPMAWGEDRCPGTCWAPRPGGEAEALLRGLRAGGGGRLGVTWGKEAGGGTEARFPPPTGALGVFVGGAPLTPELDIEMGVVGGGCCLPPLGAPTETAPPPLGPKGGPDKTPPAPPG